MKADNILKTLLVAGVALVSLNSCQEKLHPFAKGDEVKFTVGSSQDVETKAAYQEFTGSEAVDLDLVLAGNGIDGCKPFLVSGLRIFKVLTFFHDT